MKKLKTTLKGYNHQNWTIITDRNIQAHLIRNNKAQAVQMEVSSTTWAPCLILSGTLLQTIYHNPKTHQQQNSRALKKQALKNDQGHPQNTLIKTLSIIIPIQLSHNKNTSVFVAVARIAGTICSARRHTSGTCRPAQPNNVNHNLRLR